jgi:hypothetical protein
MLGTTVEQQEPSPAQFTRGGSGLTLQELDERLLGRRARFAELMREPVFTC